MTLPRPTPEQCTENASVARLETPDEFANRYLDNAEGELTEMVSVRDAQIRAEERERIASLVLTEAARLSKRSKGNLRSFDLLLSGAFVSLVQDIMKKDQCR